MNQYTQYAPAQPYHSYNMPAQMVAQQTPAGGGYSSSYGNGGQPSWSSGGHSLLTAAINSRLPAVTSMVAGASSSFQTIPLNKTHSVDAVIDRVHLLAGDINEMTKAVSGSGVVWNFKMNLKCVKTTLSPSSFQPKPTA